MKRFVLYFGIVTALVASCSTKEKDTKSLAQEDVIFYASFEQPAEEGTRVYANENLLLRWTADDRVSIFNKITYNQQYRFIGATGDYEGGFNKVDDPEFVTGDEIPHVVSVYPFRRQTRVSEDEIVSFVLPSEQLYAQDSFGLGANTMISVSSGNLLKYKNVGGYLVLNLYGEDVSVSTITLKGNNGEKLAGTASLAMPLNGVPTVTMASDATTEINLTCTVPVHLSASAEKSTQFWFVVPPVTFSKGFTVAVKETTGGYFEKSTSKVISVERNRLTKMSPTELTVVYPKAESIRLNKQELELAEGEEYQLIASVLPINAISNGILWSIEDESVATVSSTGLVTAVSVGTTTVTASIDGLSATCTVVVNPVPSPDSYIGQTPIVLAYFTEYTETLPDVTLLTHINYAHGRFKNPKTGDGGIVITESKQAPISKVVALKSVNPKLKVMLMIGGWGGHADGFSEMAKSAAKRTEFCQSVKSLIDKFQLDGVDIDWEYPTVSADGETGADPNDTQNFNLVLQELRETLGISKIISIASSPSGQYIDWLTAIQYIDYVNVMTYDMGAAPYGHNSPLHKSSRFNHRSWDEAMDVHVKAGVPKDRLVMGVPFYGKAEKNPAAGTKIFEYSVKYYEIPDILEKGIYKGKPLARAVHRQWDATAMVPFLVDDEGKNVLSYDDPESVAAKGAYVMSNGLLGAMFWEYRCDTDDHALLNALVSAIYGKQGVLQ